jgi:hypothetical protein
MRPLFLLALLLAPCIAPGQDQIAAPPPAAWPMRPVMTLTLQARKYTLNTDGSCVQCSGCQIGMFMLDANHSTLLWDTEYGRAQRGGSGPDRVANYCRQRGIEIYNVTGRSFEDTKPWMEWACRTGRFAAVGCFSRHFQTLYGRDYESDKWIIMNNWGGLFDSPYVYSTAQFKREHEASGPWVVIPKRPPPAPHPIYERWWEDDGLVTVEPPSTNAAGLPQFTITRLR